jgi:hypothetical protein
MYNSGRNNHFIQKGSLMDHEYLPDMIEEYRNVYSLHRLEGDSGIGNLNEILKGIGYRGHQFKYGSPVEAFLSDNPGAMEAILDWIGKQNCEEWRDEILTYLPEKGEEEE